SSIVHMGRASKDGAGVNTINPDGHVLVIGAAGIDVKGRPSDALSANAAMPGDIRFSLGGVARNIAENLARLEVPTVLLSAVGDDAPGEIVISRCSAAGIDVQYVLRVPGERTGAYMAFMTPTNDPNVGISAYALVGTLPSQYLTGNELLFAGASLIVIDANLPPDALSTVIELARKHRIPVCADPTSPDLAVKL